MHPLVGRRAMAKPRWLHHLCITLLLLLLFYTLPSSSSSSSSSSSCPLSFSFSDFRSLDRLLLLGDGRLSPSSTPSSSSSSVQLCGSHQNASGLLLFSIPLLLSPSLSFSTSFSFSFSTLAPEGDSLAFLITSRKDFEHAQSVKDSSPRVQVLNDFGHVTVDMEEVLSSCQNASDLKLLASNGSILFSWLDYHAPSKLLQVRLGLHQAQKPLEPHMAIHFDFAEKLDDTAGYIGFAASTGAVAHKHLIHSWDFRSWDADQHSIPVDPNGSDQASAASTGTFVVLLAVVCASVSIVALWTLVQRALRRSPREIAMLPMMLGYEQIIANESK